MKRNHVKCKKVFMTAVILGLIMVLSACAIHPSETETRKAKLNAPGTFPISKEKVTLTVGVVSSQYVEDWESNALTKELEKKANVDLEFVVFQPNDVEVKISTMIASQTKLPDILALTNVDMRKYYDSGVLIPVTEYYNDPQLAYYFHQRMNGDEERKNQLFSMAAAANGEIYGTMRYTPEIGNEYPNRMWMNQTWLDALGLPMPTTTDEFYYTLKQFVEKDPNGNGKRDEIGLIGSMDGWRQKPQDTLMNAFIYVDPEHDYLSVKDGVLDVIYNKPEYKKGLQYLHTLMQEGLFSPLSFTQNVTQLKEILEDEEIQRVGCLAAGSLSVYVPDSERKKDFVAMPPLTGPDGVCYATYQSQLPIPGAYITKYCENPDLAFRMLDCMYEETMSMWQRFGEPEVDWSTDVDGKEGLYQDSLGVSAGFTQLRDVMGAQNSCWRDLMPAYRDAYSSLSMQGLAIPDNPYDYSVYTASAVPLYMGKQPPEVIRKLVYNEEEQRKIFNSRTSLESFRSENVIRFITGDKPFSEWDSYVEELNKLGLQEFIEVSQAAYDREKKQ
ncbi:MAG: extracellular solute-binding protein [Clostridia bacterium]|nr:extracellular solute-binding protein [Clostridia bacterium]